MAPGSLSPGLGTRTDKKRAIARATQSASTSLASRRVVFVPIFRESAPPKDQPVNPSADIAQIRFIAFFQLRDGASRISGLGECFPNRRPIDITFSQIHPCISVRLALEVLQVHFCDGFAECTDPILRIAEENHIAHVKPRLNPRT